MEGAKTMTDATATPVLQHAGQGRALWHLGALLQFKALMSETGSRLWAVEGLADRTMAVPLHAHAHEDEVWYVLEGEIRFTVGDQTYALGAGSFAYIPRGVAHTFQVVSAPAGWWGFGFGGPLDVCFFEPGAPAAALTLPPRPAALPDEAAVAAIVTSLQAYGTATLGPPPNV
jgi:mannose-6-phosphate isomerase-like protein (cupin superfamily)